ncbi:AraC-type DNA-binding protein [Marinobacter daqiaonensis]|uniref:AraC-type DNA-binding protein n=1 Tax=Marinobacter daqiaonensis TaxID=650891 RepID=A0A1I6HG98_9GAMM|nr:AraC-type DNA-binding protein [Marinobacter daqiaonensis]
MVHSRELLFLGTCFGRQEAHRRTQDVLYVALKGSLRLRTGRGRPTTVRTCLVPTGLWIDESILSTSQAVVAVYFLAPFSQDHPALASLMAEALPGIFCNHPHEDDVVSAMVEVRRQPDISVGTALSRVREPLFPDHVRNLEFREYDPRVVHVARRIRESLTANMTLAELAEEVHLSESRLEKLFKEQAGLPVTQYRMRYRVFISTIIMALGYSVTEAALLAGFSSSAHLSRCYRAINGITPSATFLQPPYVHAVLAPSAYRLVEPLLESQSVV